MKMVVQQVWDFLCPGLRADKRKSNKSLRQQPSYMAVDGLIKSDTCVSATLCSDGCKRAWSLARGGNLE